MRLYLTLIFSLIVNLLVPSSTAGALAVEVQGSIDRVEINVPSTKHQSSEQVAIAFEIEEETSSFNGKKQAKSVHDKSCFDQVSTPTIHGLRSGNLSLDHRKDVLVHQPLFILQERFLI